MSLVEILVTIFVLAVGLLAVVRVLIPGLSILPQAEDRGTASVLAQDIAREVESSPERRAYSIERFEPAPTGYWFSGFRLRKDVSVGAVDQISPGETADLGTGELVPSYPSLVIGERFETPPTGGVYVVDGGPYVPEGLRVYYPEPWVEVAPGQETEPRTYSITGNLITLGPGAGPTTRFMACYSMIGGWGATDIVGATSFGGAAGPPFISVPIPNSMTLYEMVDGMTGLPRAGAIRAGAGAPPPGTPLACMYVMQSHVRTGYDEAMLTRFPEEQELRNVPVPDILSYDTSVPLNDPPTITLPFRRIAGLSQDGNPIPLDSTGPENVRVVDKVTGDIYIPGNGIVDDGPDNGDSIAAGDGFLTFDGSGPPPGTPIRVYYRVVGNWSIERHVAPAVYAHYDHVAGEFVRGSADGIKQNWYTVWEENVGGEPYTTLIFHNLPGAGGPIAGRAEDYWDGGPLLNTRSDGHRIAVDYKYAIDDPNNPGGQLIERVTGETHLVDFTTHAFTLDNPRVVQIDAVRGISYKVRACFDNATGQRSRVDVDTLAMR
jgi:hypothetical protein